MDDDHPEAVAGGESSLRTWLEVRSMADEAPLQFPVSIQNLDSGVVTLEVKLSGNQAAGVWDHLSGRAVQIFLTPDAVGKTVQVEGLILSARRPDGGRRDLIINVALAELAPGVEKIVSEMMSQAPKDLKGLWDRWDQANPDRSPVPSYVHYLAGMILIIGGLDLGFMPTPALKMGGGLLSIAGCMVIGSKVVRSLWPRGFKLY